MNLERVQFKQLGKFAAVAAIVFAFQNCSNVGFSTSAGSGNNGVQGGGGGGGGGTSCATQLQMITTPVKLLFVLDASGSNAGLTDPPSTPTDLNKVVRAGSIQQFFNDYSAKQNFYWGMIYFQEDFASAIINSGSASNPIFSSNSTVMQNAITAFQNVTDQGQTPYEAAISMASKAISSDTAVTSDTKYIVVFLSDGMPYPDPGDSVLIPELQSLLNLRPGQISFNTVYYGQSNPTASQRLANYAQIGGGQFLDTNANPTGKDFAIQNVVNVPGVVCQ